jgi:hypothetical protein
MTVTGGELAARTRPAFDVRRAENYFCTGAVLTADGDVTAQ